MEKSFQTIVAQHAQIMTSHVCKSGLVFLSLSAECYFATGIVQMARWLYSHSTYIKTDFYKNQFS